MEHDNDADAWKRMFEDWKNLGQKGNVPGWFSVTSTVLYGFDTIVKYSINDARLGYELEREQISHLFCMDDLKIFSKDHKSMQMCVTIVEKIQ